MTDHLSDAPAFAIDGVTFLCWVVDNGQRFEWRGEGRASHELCRVGRNTGNAMCWARYGDQRIGEHFASLKRAMVAAVEAKSRAARERKAA